MQTPISRLWRTPCRALLWLACVAMPATSSAQGMAEAMRRFGFDRTDSIGLPAAIVVNRELKSPSFFGEALQLIDDTAEERHFQKLSGMVHPDSVHLLTGVAVRYGFATLSGKDRLTPYGNTTGDFFTAMLDSAGRLHLRLAGPFTDYYPETVVEQGLAKTDWHVWHKYDRTARLSLTDTLTNRLEVPAHTMRVVLSDSMFVPGQMLYGYVAVSTGTYFEMYGGDGSDGETPQRHYVDYGFKALIVDEAYLLEAEKRRQAHIQSRAR